MLTSKFRSCLAILLFSSLQPVSLLHSGECNSPPFLTLKDGRRLTYEEHGNPSGKPVFYFHGLNSSGQESRVLDGPAKSAGIRLIALDRPGIGQCSPCPDRKHLDWVCDVEQAAARLGFGGQKFGIIGVSGGAAYATACLAKIPNRLNNVVLVSPYSPFDLPGVDNGIEANSVKVSKALPPMAYGILTARSKRLCKQPEKVIENIFKSWAEVDKKAVLCDEEAVQGWIDNLNYVFCNGVEGVITDVLLHPGDCGHWDFQVQNPKCVPVQIWHGECDITAPPSMGRWYHQQLKGSRFVLVPREGHITVLIKKADSILAAF